MNTGHATDMKQEQTDFICNKAHEITEEIWGTEHMKCFGNLEVKIQEVIKKLITESLSPAAGEESLTVEPITAEEWFDNHFDCYSSEDFNQKVIPCMTKEVFLQFVSLKPTVAKRER